MLIVTVIPAWLIGIQLSRLAPEKQALIFRFQDEAVDTLYSYFFTGGARPDAQATSERSSEPGVAPDEWVEAEAISSLPDDIWERQYQVMAGFEREWRAMKADIASLNTKLTENEVRMPPCFNRGMKDFPPCLLLQESRACGMLEIEKMFYTPRGGDQHGQADPDNG